MRKIHPKVRKTLSLLIAVLIAEVFFTAISVASIKMAIADRNYGVIQLIALAIALIVIPLGVLLVQTLFCLDEDLKAAKEERDE